MRRVAVTGANLYVPAMRARLVLAALLAAGLALPAGADAKRLLVVQANVGNINAACAPARYKLCQPPVAARAARALRNLRPDVVGFEELRPDRRQARRLLGPGYAVACDARYGWDCLAVRRAAGVRLVGGLRTRPAPAGCDDGFTTNRAILRVAGRRVAVALGHPNSMDVACRAQQVRDLFRGFARRGPALVLGDFNLDPFREADASVAAFSAARERLHLRLASGRAFSLLPGPSQGDPTGTQLDDGTTPFPRPFSDRTLDLVLTRGLRGSCSLRRVDGGGGMDHRAQVCRLRIRATAARRHVAFAGAVS